MKKLNKKLDYIKIGLFLVKKSRELINYFFRFFDGR